MIGAESGNHLMNVTAKEWVSVCRQHITFSCSICKRDLLYSVFSNSDWISQRNSFSHSMQKLLMQVTLI